MCWALGFELRPEAIAVLAHVLNIRGCRTYWQDCGVGFVVCLGIIY